MTTTPTSHDAVSRREVVDRLREVASEHATTAQECFNMGYEEEGLERAISFVLRTLADEFQAEDSVKSEKALCHSPVVIPQNLQLTLVEIRERSAETDRECARTGSGHTRAELDRDTLLQIIDSLTATAVCPRCSALMTDFPESRTSSAFCDGCGYEQPRNPITQATSGLPSEQLPDASSLRHLYNLLKEYGQHKRSCTVETTDCVCGFSEKISNLVPPSALPDPQRRTPHLFEPHDSDEDDSNYCRICDKYQFDQRFHLTPSPLPEGREQLREIAFKVARAWCRSETLELNGQLVLSIQSNPESVLTDYIEAALNHTRATAPPDEVGGGVDRSGEFGYMDRLAKKLEGK